MKRLFTLSIALLLLLLSGCMYDAADEGQASRIVDQWHAAFKAKEWDKAFALYDKSFLAEHPREAWQQHLAQLTDRFGALKDIRPTFQQKDPRFRGDYYMFGFVLVFEKGTATETVTVFKGIENDKLTIAGQMIQPKSHSN